jgi:hypothetical protein
MTSESYLERSGKRFATVFTPFQLSWDEKKTKLAVTRRVLTSDHDCTEQFGTTLFHFTHFNTFFI